MQKKHRINIDVIALQTTLKWGAIGINEIPYLFKVGKNGLSRIFCEISSVIL